MIVVSKVIELANQVAETRQLLEAAKKATSIVRNEECTAQNNHDNALKKFRDAVAEFDPDKSSGKFFSDISESTKGY